MDLLQEGLRPSEVLTSHSEPFGARPQGDCKKRRHSERSEESARLEGKLREESQRSFGLRPQDDVPLFNPEKEIEAGQKLGICLITWFDTNYPKLLKEIFDPPLVLYVYGSLEPGDENALAIVGTRVPSFYGLDQAKRFARSLAESGITIVSGFARGIDQAAHQAALEIKYGRTIAVLGCGLDIEYPKGSRKLFDQIKERGALISEYALGTAPLADNFPRRNRIISGLSLGVLVVEASLPSGSLITAHEALEQGREIFAVPGPVDQLTSQGTHRLLKEGATLVTDPIDILESLGPVIARQRPMMPKQSEIEGSEIASSASTPRNDSAFCSPLRDSAGVDTLNKEEEKLVGLLTEPLVYDELSLRSSLSPGRLSACLVELEIKKKIQKLPSGHFTLR